MKVTEKPINEIIIDQLEELTLDEFLDSVIGEERIGWCNGYLLGFDLPEEEAFDKGIFEKQIRYYRGIEYCKFPTYQPEIKNRLSQTLVIIDHSPSKIRKAIISYINSKTKGGLGS